MQKAARKGQMARVAAAAVMLYGAVRTGRAQTSQPSPLFDPERHMRVADVKPGMKGYGLTVFHGSRIEKFDVEVMDIARNMHSGFDAVLINCPGERMAHLGSVEGMSGSPIYLYGQDGKARLLGAFAFGWEYAKDALVGVQPIEYMLAEADPKVARAGSVWQGEPKGGKARWSLADVRLPNGDGRTPVSLMISGGTSASLARIAPIFERFGLRAQVGGGGAPERREMAAGAATQPVKMEPGASLVIPLSSGDIEANALGTCTEVIGDRVFAFGHKLGADGGVELPFAGGYVNAIVASLASSFKMGGPTENLGVLKADTEVGIGGILGETAQTIPVTVHVVYADGTLVRDYHAQIVRHMRLTPVLIAAVINASMTAVRELPVQSTVKVDLDLAFGGGRQLHLSEAAADARAMDLLEPILLPLLATTGNPFEPVFPQNVEATVKVFNTASKVQIKSATLSRRTYGPGDVAVVNVAVMLPHGSTENRRIRFEIPESISPGTHTLTISDVEQFASEAIAANPEDYSASNVDELFAALAARAGLKNEAFYLRLMTDKEGLAVGRIGLQGLPASRLRLLTDAGSADVLPSLPSVTKVVPQSEIVTGSAEVELVIEGEVKGASGSGAMPKKGKQGHPLPGSQQGGKGPGGNVPPSLDPFAGEG